MPNDLKQQHKDYVGLVYDEARTPKTDYPAQFAQEMCRRYDLAPGMSFLEIGCGRGDFLKAFSGQGLQCRAVDQSNFSVKTGASICQVDACNVEKEPLPLKDASMDIVYSKSLVEHMWDPRFLMSEIMRVLKPGGICITLTPDWVSQMPVFYEDYTHCRPYTTDALRDLKTVSGFTDVHSELFMQLPEAWSSKPHALLAKTLGMGMGTLFARRMTAWTGIKFFRWAVEKMVLATGRKPE